MSYYNEIELYAVEWLWQLILADHIDDGMVDTRSIVDVPAEDVSATSHFFAGIGVWSYALRLAGWPNDVPVWTGSCPCQPFSVAGKRKGVKDDRHLWPAWRRLIEQCRPPIIFGEQVASPTGRAWLDAVSADLEALGFAVGAADLCAAGVGAPHVRQRLFWVAVSDCERRKGIRLQLRERQSGASLLETSRSSKVGNVANADGKGLAVGESQRRDTRKKRKTAKRGGFWSGADWLACRDGRARPVEPGAFPLVDGLATRVGRLRAYGNAIVAPLAAEFIRASMAAISE